MTSAGRYVVYCSSVKLYIGVINARLKLLWLAEKKLLLTSHDPIIIKPQNRNTEQGKKQISKQNNYKIWVVLFSMSCLFYISVPQIGSQ